MGPPEVQRPNRLPFSFRFVAPSNRQRSPSGAIARRRASVIALVPRRRCVRCGIGRVGWSSGVERVSAAPGSRTLLLMPTIWQQHSQPQLRRGVITPQRALANVPAHRGCRPPPSVLHDGKLRHALTERLGREPRAQRVRRKRRRVEPGVFRPCLDHLGDGASCQTGVADFCRCRLMLKCGAPSA